MAPTHRLVFELVLESLGLSWDALTPDQTGRAFGRLRYQQDLEMAKEAAHAAAEHALALAPIDWNSLQGDAPPACYSPRDVDVYYASRLPDRLGEDATSRVLLVCSLVESGAVAYTRGVHMVVIEEVARYVEMRPPSPATLDEVRAASARATLATWEETTHWTLAMKMAVLTWKHFWRGRAETAGAEPKVSIIETWIKEEAGTVGGSFSDSAVQEIQRLTRVPPSRSGR